MHDGYVDLLREAVGFIATDGELRAENRAMVDLCREFFPGAEERVTFLELPFHPDDRAALAEFLASGADSHEFVVQMHRATGDLVARMTLARRDGGHWVIVQDETEQRYHTASALRLERLRLAGAMGKGLVHDLNNLMGSVIGLAEYLLEEQLDPDQRRVLQNIVAGTKDQGAILECLRQLIVNRGVHRQRVALDTLVGDTLAMFQKTADHNGMEFSSDIASDLLEVRVVPEIVMQALLFLLTPGLETGQGVVHVEARREVIPGRSAGLPSRTYGVIRVFDDGDPQEAAHLHHLLAHPEQGISLDESNRGLFMALLSLRACGASFHYEGIRRGMRTTALFLPSAGTGGAR